MRTLTLLFLFLGFQLQAQNKFVTEYRYDQKVTISDGGNSNAGAFIKILAEGNGKSPRSTFYYLSFGQLMYVITREPKFVYNIESESMRLSGDVNYKGFDVSDYLLPAEAKFALRQKAKSGLFWDRPLAAKVDSGKIGLASYNDTDSISPQYTNFDLINFELKFGSTAQLEKKVAQINSYYSTISDLDRAFGMVQGVNSFAYENFRNNQRNLVESENILKNALDAKHENHLPLEAHDPGKYLEKRTILNNLLIGKRIEFNQVLSTLHLTFFDKGLGFIRNKNYNKAQDYFLWSLEVNPMFTPALFQLAFIDFTQGNLHEAVCKSDDILYNLPVDPETKDFTIDLLKEIYSVYIQQGEAAYTKNKYRNAIDEYESARSICEKYDGVPCGDELSRGMSLAKSGIYKEYLEEARDLIIINEFSQAEILTQTAIQFQNNNKKFIPDGSEASNLMEAIRQKKYDQFISQAVRLTDQKMYDAALEKLEEAHRLAELHHLKPNKDFRTLTLNAARPRTLEFVFEGNGFVKSNNLNSAREKYSLATESQKNYFLMEDKDINKHLETLRKSIFTQQCINAQYSVDSAYNKGQDIEAEMDYLAANASYEYGITVASNNRDCEINVDSLESAIQNIRTAVTYLELMKEVRNDEIKGRFQTSMDNYEKASKYYLEFKINNFGLDHDPDLFAFIKNKGSNGMLNYAASRYREQNELDHSLTLYKLLIDRNYDISLIDGSLYKLGFQLGQTDKKLNPGSKWRELVKVYTNDNKKLKRLRKGYKKGFKSK
ncbi:MAG: hypothetical protein IPJ26_10070 [Bacteroidetes bacterium]|nr:hypothetical protein [Bacteroidota bacterium]